MVRGRPVFSEVRQNMVEILAVMGRAYGYDLYKVYSDIFPSITMRLVYYHLGKGVSLGEFKVDKVEKETGDFSWGSVVEKTYYTLGDNAQVKGSSKVMSYFDRKNKN